MQLTHLVYASTYVDEYGVDLPDFIETFVVTNVEPATRGMTLFSGGNIIQLIEGDYRLVNDVFMKLKHQGKQFEIMKLLNAPIEHHCLLETSIGFGRDGLKFMSKSPNKIALFQLHPAEVDKRVLECPSKVLMMQFAFDFGNN